MDKIKKLQEEIDKIKVELVMEGYNNGWAIKWYKKRLCVLESRLLKNIRKKRC